MSKKNETNDSSELAEDAQALKSFIQSALPTEKNYSEKYVKDLLTVVNQIYAKAHVFKTSMTTADMKYFFPNDSMEYVHSLLEYACRNTDMIITFYPKNEKIEDYCYSASFAIIRKDTEII